MKYQDEVRNPLANKDDASGNLHLMPKDRTLWAVERYEDFIAQRQCLIAHQFAWLLTPSKS